MIIPPMMKDFYEDRALDCQLALELAVQELVDKAIAAGWDRTEAIAAVANIGINFLAADAESRKTEQRIAEVLGRVTH